MFRESRLDAIVYRTGGKIPYYISEHASCKASHSDFRSSLLKLSDLVKSDIDDGLYSLNNFSQIRSFVTYADASLDLRDAPVTQPFLCRVDEMIDYRNRTVFNACCPTNYANDRASRFEDAVSALSQVVSIRYRGESMNDLLRELPRKPLLTTFSLSGDSCGERPPEVTAVIEREGNRYVAKSPWLDIKSEGRDTYDALKGLERAISETHSRPLSKDNLVQAEPVYGQVDVKLLLKGGFSIRRFLLCVALRCTGSGRNYFSVYSPQANVSSKSYTIDGAMDNISNAIALEFHEKPQADVESVLRSRQTLTTARVYN